MWWGSKDQRPILCLHGWQDNANTFNTLIPQLSPNFSYLAIDLPGHGLSSHFGNGLSYKTYEMVYAIKRVQDHFKWDKVSLMGHSYGGACSFIFSSCFPDDVDFFIAIDIIKPMSLEGKYIIKSGSKIVNKLLEYEKRKKEDAPSYSKENLVNRWVKGSGNSLIPETCEILMKRGTTVENGLYKLTRDYRMKTSFTSSFSQKENVELANGVRCNVLMIKSKKGHWFEKKENPMEVINVLKKKAKRFDYHELPGTHHIHLNNPDVVAPVVNSFITSVTAKK